VGGPGVYIDNTGGFGYAHIRDVRSVSNGSSGIIVINVGIVRDCTASQNKGIGIGVGSSSVVRNNVVFGNGGFFALVAQGRGVIQGNAVSSNAGVSVAAHIHDVVIGNSIAGGQGGIALEATSQTGYAQNAILSNTGTVSGSPIELGLNLCGSNTTCP
jgi:hypothetical protein